MKTGAVLLFCAVAVPVALRAAADRFDPVAAGWPCVFSEDFDGTSVDWGKWMPHTPTTTNHVSVKDGFLRIEAVLGKGGKVEPASLWTRRSFKYGYFEARVRFTRQNGYWSAFWLYGDTVENPFLDGFEIDIFEDFPRRRRDVQGCQTNVLAHNIYLHANATTKGYKCYAPYRETEDGFHVVACRWTPFEIVCTVDGVVARGKPRDAAFDAFSAGNGTAPLHAIVSTHVMDAKWNEVWQDTSACVFPDRYLVDWVRIYAWPDPEEGRPAVSWRESFPPDRFEAVREGETRTFAVEAASGGGPIASVRLFDGGFFLAEKKDPPYVFEIPFTEAFYGTTSYLARDTQGVVPGFSGRHALVAFAEDAAGRVAHTSPRVLYVCPRTAPSLPYAGRPQAIPGEFMLGRYDEGGQGVAYGDTTKANRNKSGWRPDEGVDCSETGLSHCVRGEWINYTVDVARAGAYEMRFRYGSQYRPEKRLSVLVDGAFGATTVLGCQSSEKGWEPASEGSLVLGLPAGRHVLRLLVDGVYNIDDVRFLTWKGKKDHE